MLKTRVLIFKVFCDPLQNAVQTNFYCVLVSVWVVLVVVLVLLGVVLVVALVLLGVVLVIVEVVASHYCY